MDHYLDNLISHWSSLKKIEAHYSDERVKTEQAIQNYMQEHDQWKEIGTMSLGAVKIRTQYRRKWNHEKLDQIKADHQLSEMQFPFAIEYKEIKAQSDYLSEREPEIWQMIAPALTLYPTKPYFFIPKKGENHGIA